LVFSLIGCSQDLCLKDVVVTNRFYSPDSSYVAFIYYIDYGAMGESRSMASVLKVEDTLGSLNTGRLPCRDLPFSSCYFPDRWISSKTLEVTLNELSFAKAGLPFDSTGIKVNGIDCKVVPLDNTHRRAPSIKYLSFSGDRKKILVEYEYTGGLNISAIRYGDQLPKYGNVVTIPEASLDPIRYAAWSGDTIQLYMKDARLYRPVDYIDKGVVEKVDFVELGQVAVPDDSVLFEDARIDSLLRQEGVIAKGVIIKSLWGMKGDKSVFNCAYEY
jgi:hypothetical protein